MSANGKLITNVDNLLSSVPDENDIAALSLWFARVEKWSDENNQKQIKQDATKGLTNLMNPTSRQQNKYSIVSRLSVLKE